MPPRPRIPLPPFLEGTAFTIAQARSVGWAQGRMPGKDLEHPFRGVRMGRADAGSAAWLIPEVAQATAERDLVRRCAALLVALPGGAFVSQRRSLSPTDGASIDRVARALREAGWRP